MLVARFKSSQDCNNHPPDLKHYKGYSISISWDVGRITGAYIESMAISHILSFGGNKATLIIIDFGNGAVTFLRPLPSTLSSLYITVFTSEKKFYSLGQEVDFYKSSNTSI